MNRKTTTDIHDDYYNSYIQAVLLREKISEVLRRDQTVQQTLTECLKSLIETVDAKFARVWLFNAQTTQLELVASAGKFPPLGSIRQKLNFGEFAVGKIAKTKKALFSNNIYKNNKGSQTLTQNQSWAKKNKLIAFAGYPLLFKNNLVGTLTLFSTHRLSSNVLDLLASVADILAQEITRRKIEEQLSESQLRYLSFITQSSEGIWRFETDKPLKIKLPISRQVDNFYKYAYLAECNDALAKMYGLKKASDIIGARLGSMLIRENPENVTYLENFIKSGYNLASASSTERDHKGNILYFENSLVGIIENDCLIRVWGTQRDITEQRKAQDQLRELGRQKDEFIAIASHELKTPVTSLKAYTQILEKRLHASGDITSSLMLWKMDQQLNKLTALITDLLDISKIEAGKLVFQITHFKLNPLLKETIEEMGRTTESHKLQLKLGKDCTIEGDRDRISQVLINFISNAIKYSPDAKKILIKSRRKDKTVKVSVQDFGIGIDESERKLIFDRFFRGSNPNMNSYPGLGLGLYICAEIINRHSGKIGVTSKKGTGSTFHFTLPII